MDAEETHGVQQLCDPRIQLPPSLRRLALCLPHLAVLASG